LKLAFNCIDLTSLNSDETFEKIEKMTQKVNNFSQHFPEMPNVAAMCVYPNVIGSIRKVLTIMK
jgi:deoxyribose-phosphate aldolase